MAVVRGALLSPNFSLHTNSSFFYKAHPKQICVRGSSVSGSNTDKKDNESKKSITKETNGCWKIDFSGEKPPTPLLDTVNYPVHLKNLSIQDLEQIGAEIRAELVYTVAKTGGHLSSSLGVTDLTVALHYVFNTPDDKLIWDVGHQAYPHKILTGRRSKMETIRKTSRLAGFPKRDESMYDAFGAGHSSTSISAGLGTYMMTNNGGSETYKVAAKVDEYTRGMMGGSGSSSLFEELGLYYIGPVDGHNMQDLVTVFTQVKQLPAPGPVLIHVVTQKGKGYPPAEQASDKMHGVVKFDLKSGNQLKSKTSTLPYTRYFAESLIKEAEADDKIVAVHAAMGGGTGLNYFQKKFPNRCFDVGIAEQHAVTFSAGLATEGLKPFCTIYSTFLQRGFDQICSG